MSKTLLGKRFDDDYTVEELKGIYDDITSSVTVPVNVVIKAEHRVLDLARMKEILKDADYIVLSDCGCRVDKGNCEAPIDTCLSLDSVALEAELLGRYNPKEVKLDEALDALRRSHEAGNSASFVLNVTFSPRPRVLSKKTRVTTNTPSW